MKIKSLTIKKMAGFSTNPLQLNSEQLCDGLNVIYGPNGSGKTTLCRAIKELLFPAKSDEQLLLTSSLESDGKEFTLSVAKKTNSRVPIHTVYPKECEGELKKIPSSLYASCFFLSIDTLFAAEDKDLSHQLQTQLQGGFDAAPLRKEQWLQAPSKLYGRTEWKLLSAAKKELFSVKVAHSKLEEEKEQLELLSKEIEKARLTAKQIRYYELSKEFLFAKQRFEFACAHLATFPKEMTFFYEGATKQLQAIEEDIALQQDKLALLLSEKQSYPELKQKEQMDEKEILLSLQRVEKAKQQLKELDFIDNQKEIICKKIEQESLFLGCDTIDFDKISLAQLQQLELLLDKKGQMNRYKEELVAQIESLEGNYSLLSDEQLQQGIKLTNRYFAAKELTVPLLLLLLLTGISFILTLFSYPVSAAFLACLFIFLLWLARPLLPIFWEKEFAKSGLAITVANKKQSQVVWELRKELEKQLSLQGHEKAQTVLKTGLALRLQRLENQQLDLDSQLALYDSMLQINQLGYGAARQLFFEAMRRVKELKGELIEWNQKEQHFEKEFVQTGETETVDLEKKAIYLAELLEKIKEEKRLEEKLIKLSGAIEQCQKELLRFYARKEQLLEQLCLPAENPSALLQERALLFESFCKAQKDCEETKRDCLRLDAELIEKNSLTLQELDEKLGELEEKNRQLQPLIEKKTLLEFKLQSAMQGSDLEEKNYQVVQSQLALKEKFHAAIFSCAAQLLLKNAEKEHLEATEPKQIKYASELLRKFTEGRYSLTLDPEGGFVAYDHREESYLPLEALSRGTRIQLIISIRLAFLSTLEGAEKIPLVFDEAMAHSDSSRFETMADLIATIVASGRQVFYLTCWEEDQALWQAVSKRHTISFKWTVLNTSTAPL